MSQNKILLPLIGAAVIAGGGAAAYYYVTTQQGGSLPFIGQPAQTDVVKNIPAVKAIPQNALAVMTVNIDGTAFQKLERFFSPNLKQLVDKRLEEFNRGLNQNADLREFQEWSGGQLVIAFLPPQTPSAYQPSLYRPVSFRTAQAQPNQPPVTPPLAMILQVKDQGKAKAFIEKNSAKQGVKTKTTDYKGVSIMIAESQERSGTLAFVDQFLVLADSEASIHRVIDTLQGGTAIGNDLPTTGLDVENPVFAFYVPNIDKNAQVLVDLLAKTRDADAIPPNLVGQLQRFNSMGMVAGIDDKGVRIRLATKYNIDIPSTNSPNQIPSLLPNSTIGLITGMNIKQQWENAVRVAESDPELKQAIELMRSALRESPLKIDLDKEIFGWMDGEYGIGVIRSDQEFLAEVGVGPIAMFQTSDRATAEALLKKLDNYATENGAQVSTKDINGVQVTVWGSPFGNFIAHGWIQPNTLFIGAAPLVATFAPKPQTSLAEESSFQTMLGSLTGNANGYFFLDMVKLVELVKKQLPPNTLDNEADDLLQTVQGIGVSYVVPDSKTTTLDILISLKPRQ